MKTLTVSAVVFALCASAQVHAQILNLQLGSGEPLYVGTGADPNDTGTVFTQVESDATMTDLADQNGTAQTGVSFGIAGTNGFGARYDNTGLFNGYTYLNVANAGLSATFSFSGLTAEAGDPFTLYVYGGNDGGLYRNRSVQVSLTDDGDGSGTAVGGDPSSFSDPGNYTTITGTIGPDGMVTGTLASPNNASEADLNGLQLDITAAPEPSTYALLGFAAGSLLLARRKLA